MAPKSATEDYSKTSVTQSGDMSSKSSVLLVNECKLLACDIFLS